ncbi:hypothetical protein V2G26_007384 [Clonostachys chloroleuca]
MSGSPVSTMSIVNVHIRTEPLEYSQNSMDDNEIVREDYVPIPKGGDGDGNDVKSVITKTAAFRKSHTSPLNRYINFSVINPLVSKHMKILILGALLVGHPVGRYYLPRSCWLHQPLGTH